MARYRHRVVSLGAARSSLLGSAFTWWLAHTGWWSHYKWLAHLPWVSREIWLAILFRGGCFIVTRSRVVGVLRLVARFSRVGVFIPMARSSTVDLSLSHDSLSMIGYLLRGSSLLVGGALCCHGCIKVVAAAGVCSLPPFNPLRTLALLSAAVFKSTVFPVEQSEALLENSGFSYVGLPSLG